MSFVKKIPNIFSTSKKQIKEKKHVTSLINDSGMKITSPKEILKEEETFFQTFIDRETKILICQSLTTFFKPKRCCRRRWLQPVKAISLLRSALMF